MILDKMSLGGKKAVVTGASRGLGQGIAVALAEAGADVAVVGRTEAGLNETAAKIESVGRRAFPIVADVSSVPQAQGAVESARASLGRIDILVNAAGTQVRKSALELTEADWDAVLSVNAKAAFFCSQAAARIMIKQGGGRMINIASLTTEIGLPNVAAYATSKGGVGQLTKALAIEWAQYGINVNAIGPGYYRTHLTERLFQNPENVQWLLSRIPLKRTGVPEDLAGTAVFLASEASEYITGQIIYVDGGWLAG